MVSLPKQSTFVNECLSLGYKHALVANMFYHIYFFPSSDLRVNRFVIMIKSNYIALNAFSSDWLVTPAQPEKALQFYWNKVDGSKWFAMVSSFGCIYRFSFSNYYYYHSWIIYQIAIFAILIAFTAYHIISWMLNVEGGWANTAFLSLFTIWCVSNVQCSMY